MSKLLEVNQLCKSFGSAQSVKDVCFSLEKGESIGILGKNGSGKSTLLKMIAGVLQPSAGSVQIRGQVAALLELGSGFNPEYSGLDNIELYGRLLGFSKSELEAKRASIIEFADIGEAIKQPVRTYSSGMSVRLAFAVSCAREPDLFIIDEALAVGDEAFSRKCFARLEHLQKQGCSILLVTHNTHAILQFCKRALLMHQGKLIFDGEPKTAAGLYSKILYGQEPTAQPKPEKALFLQNLVSQSRLEYTQLGACIDNPHILTLDGQKVNVLCSGEEYLYRYSVTFSCASLGVQFGMLIKTHTGLELGGACQPSQLDRIESVAAGQNMQVTFRFRALLSTGTYFMNAGVQGLNELQPEGGYLHRILDAIMFKVQPAPGQVELPTGLVRLVGSGTYTTV